MSLAAWAQARRRLPFGDRLVRHPQRQAAAPPKAGFIGSPIPDLEFHLPEMMPAIGVVLVRRQKETRLVASRALVQIAEAGHTRGKLARRWS